MADSFLTTLLDSGDRIELTSFLKPEPDGKLVRCYTARVSDINPLRNFSRGNYRTKVSKASVKATFDRMIANRRKDGAQMPFNITDPEKEMFRVVEYWLSLEGDAPEVSAKSISFRKLTEGYVWQIEIRWCDNWFAVPAGLWREDLLKGCYAAVSLAINTIVDARAKISQGK